jgi:hypothetical protein
MAFGNGLLFIWGFFGGDFESTLEEGYFSSETLIYEYEVSF